MLEREELKRYNRQIILPEFGLAGQEKLKSARVLLIGAGGLGCPVLQYLVGAGVGAIGIVDDDVVDLSNLHRQILYSVADVSKLKVIIAKEKLEQLNPFVIINPYSERLTTKNAERIIKLYDLVIDGSDNFDTRYLVNDTCVKLNKPLVFGSIFKFEGHVSVFNYKNGPQYRDVFPEAPLKDEVPNCAEMGVIGVLPGLIGTYMANEAIKIICGIGETLSGKLFIINSLDNSSNIFSLYKQQFVKSNETDKMPVKATEETLSSLEITLEQLHILQEQNSKNIYLIDVRETYEFEDFNIGGVNIPLYELKDQFDSIPVNKKLIFYCQTGQRSKIAIQILKPLYKGEMLSVKNGIV